MIDPSSFDNAALRGGFTIVQVAFAAEPLADALGREAIAQTGIVGRKFHLRIRSGLGDESYP